MPDNGRAMRLYLWVPAAILGLLGVYVVVARAVLAETDTDKWKVVLVFSTALLLPAVLYLLTLHRYLRTEAQLPDLPRPAGANPGAFPLVLSVALYLPLMILVANDQYQWKHLLESGPLFLVLWIFCACANQWLRGERTVVPVENSRSPRVLERCLQMTSRFLPPPVLLLLGAVLLACSPWTEYVFDLLRGREMWITAHYGLGDQIPAAGLFLDYFGRFVYGGSLLLAACTVVLLLVCRLSSARMRATHAAAVLGLATGLLAICSITDYFFSWQSFELPDRPLAVHWILFCLFFLHWTVPLLLAFAFLRAPDRAEQTMRLELRTLVVFYAPLLLFDLGMAPFFVGDSSYSFVLVAFLGLQFLAWGYLQLAAFPQRLKT